MASDFVRESLLQESEGDKIRCNVCGRRCLLGVAGHGWCRTRENRGGKPEVPWHVTAYSPAYQFSAPPTPVSTLERAWQIGKDAGLQFVYLGNMAGHKYDNTYCPACDALLIQRFGFEVVQNKLRAGRCPQCARPVAGVWGRQATFPIHGGSQWQN